MTGITSHETQEVEAANASGRTPVVFVHGLWPLPSSWDRWQTVFEDAVADLSLTFIRRFVEPRAAGTRELAGAGVG